MAVSTYLDQIQQLYIAYFGRPADPIGQTYWASQVDANNGSIASVIAGFSASTESAALFGNKSTIDKVTAIYMNAFGRAPSCCMPATACRAFACSETCRACSNRAPHRCS